MKLRHFPYYFFIILFSCVEPTLVPDKDCSGARDGDAVVDGCGICGGSGDGSDCNNNGILDDCETSYDAGYKAGIARSDLNKDGTENILDIVKLVESVLKKMITDIFIARKNHRFFNKGQALCT